MPVNFSKSLVIDISSRASFDLEAAERVLENEGVEAYAACQKAKEDEIPVGFQTHLYLDNQESHYEAAAQVVSTG